MEASSRSPPVSRDDFTIAIFCVLPVERNAVEAIFNETWDGQFGKARGDLNTYSHGRILDHDVVLVHVPEMGKVAAATTASNLRPSYHNITLRLLVGVCGASPTDKGREIVLGDVIISDGIIQADFGRQFSDGIRAKDGIKDSLPRADVRIRSLLAKLSGKRSYEKLVDGVSSELNRLLAQPNFAQEQYPGPSNDHLYDPTYRHKHRRGADCATCDDCQDERHPVCKDALEMTCEELECDSKQLVTRARLAAATSPQGQPKVHFGSFASGDQVMKSAAHRDRLIQQRKVIGFEMEGAGVWDAGPTVIIKGVCDYADSHKDKKWQGYAGVAAAACAKAFLREWIHTPGPASNPTESAEEKAKAKECLTALRLTDPEEDMRQIKARKDSLLDGSCDWVSQDPAFKEWWQGSESDIFWLHGDPGKGKTMIMLALVEEIKRRTQSLRVRTAYFFCQSAASTSNNAAAVLRGLIYLLVANHESLLAHVLKRYEQSGAALFEGSRAIDSLWVILDDIVADPELDKVYLLIDALDECDLGAAELLRYITRRDLKRTSKAHWLISGRNEPHLLSAFSRGDLKHHISLEINAARVEQAIKTFIDAKVIDLSYHLSDDESDLKSFVRDTLIDNADGTFLWVAIVCQHLETIPPWNVREEITKFPSGLTAVYDRMTYLIGLSEDSDEDAKYCSRLLRAVTMASRPLTSDEARFAADLPRKRFQTTESMKRLAEHCRSFLTFRGDVLHLIHKSASDYILGEGRSKLFPFGIAVAHVDVARRCFDLMADKLHMNMCNINPGDSPDAIESGHLAECLPANVRYACLYWHYHLTSAIQCGLQPDPALDVARLVQFFQKTSIFWFECLGLLQRIPEGRRVLEEMEPVIARFQHLSADIMHVFMDKKLFYRTIQLAAEQAPMQLYHSGLAFAPKESRVLQDHQNLIEDGISIHPRLTEWDSSLHVLEGSTDGGSIVSLVFSNDSTLIASKYTNGAVRIWDSTTGAALSLLRSNNPSRSRATLHRLLLFSHDDRLVVARDTGGWLCVWDHSRSTLLHTYSLDEYYFRSVAASIDFGIVGIATSSTDDRLALYDLSTNRHLHTLEVTNTPTESSHAVLASHKGVALLAYESGVVRTYDVATAKKLRDFEHDFENISNVAISSDGTTVAVIDYNARAKIWTPKRARVWNLDLGDNYRGWSRPDLYVTPESLRAYMGNGAEVFATVFDVFKDTVHFVIEEGMKDATKVTQNDKLIMGYKGQTAFVWDASDGALLSRIGELLSEPECAALSSDNAFMALGFPSVRVVRIWNVERKSAPFGSSSQLNAREDVTPEVDEKFAKISTGQTNPAPNDGFVISVVFSNDRQIFAVEFEAHVTNSIAVYDTVSRALLFSFGVPKGKLTRMVFCPDDRYILRRVWKGKAIVWEISTKRFLDWPQICASLPWARNFGDVFSSEENISTANQDPQMPGHPEFDPYERCSNPDRETLWLEDLQFSPIGDMVLLVIITKVVDRSMSAAASIQCRFTGNMKVKLHITDSPGLVSSECFSPDGRFVAIAFEGWSEGKEVKIWDLSSRPISETRLRLGRLFVSSIAFNQDNTLVAVGSRFGTIKVWSVSKRQLVQQLHDRITECENNLRSALGWLDSKSLGQYHGLSISADRRWIKRGDQRVLWLPEVARSRQFAISNNLVILGTEAGRVFFIQL